jgi:hypothetical protein
MNVLDYEPFHKNYKRLPNQHTEGSIDLTRRIATMCLMEVCRICLIIRLTHHYLTEVNIS